MDSSYEFRYGVYAKAIYLQHCLLAANGYQSWRGPTGQNKIDWTPQGRAYVRRLYSKADNIIKIQYRSINEFLRALLNRDLYPPSSVLYNELNTRQKDTFNRYYYTHRDDELLPEDKFGDDYTVAGLSLYQPLWLGAGFPPREFMDHSS